eukprot:scaffold48599_cov38-Prasinocladus_malaysianus.AAC.1
MMFNFFIRISAGDVELRSARSHREYTMPPAKVFSRRGPALLRDHGAMIYSSCPPVVLQAQCGPPAN